mmetsp:Transcript_42760/g.70901  ORF Transcript_42760/g.70901 Transcript_42760/m.70901 type:complete len:178 (-) Transcript_42760:258-791(-)
MAESKSGGGVTVAEEGNRRRGRMGAEEVTQCVLDIVSWFKSHTECFENVQPGDKSGVQSLSKAIGADVPEELEEFMLQINGGAWLYEKKCLSLEESVDKVLQEGHVTIASDVDGNYLVADVESPGTKLYEYDESDGLGSCVASSFSSYIEEYRNLLLSGKCEFIEDTGIVEEMAGGK